MIYIRNKTPNIKRSLQKILQIDDINGFHYFEIPPSFVDQKEIHDFWEMVYIESGNASITSDDEVFHMSEGTLIFHKPGEIHAIESANNSVIRAFFISFSSSSEITKLFESSKILLKSEHKDMLQNLYKEAQSLYHIKSQSPLGVVFSLDSFKPNCPTGAQQLFKMHFEEFLISVIRLIEEKESILFYESKDELDSFILIKLMEKIHSAVYTDLTIADLCEELGCGRTYLSALFKKKTGKTIMTYYNTLKIAEAKKLIEAGKLSLSEISDMLHFSTRYYFPRVFKRIEGITPSEYKASLQNRKE